MLSSEGSLLAALNAVAKTMACVLKWVGLTPPFSGRLMRFEISPSCTALGAGHLKPPVSLEMSFAGEWGLYLVY